MSKIGEIREKKYWWKFFVQVHWFFFEQWINWTLSSLLLILLILVILLTTHRTYWHSSRKIHYCFRTLIILITLPICNQPTNHISSYLFPLLVLLLLAYTDRSFQLTTTNQSYYQAGYTYPTYLPTSLYNLRVIQEQPINLPIFNLSINSKSFRNNNPAIIIAKLDISSINQLHPFWILSITFYFSQSNFSKKTYVKT